MKAFAFILLVIILLTVLGIIGWLLKLLAYVAEVLFEGLAYCCSCLFCGVIGVGLLVLFVTALLV